ncbi:fluoride efflux transporter CrcB [Bacillus sp. AK031]
MTLAWIAVGGFIGAIFRFLIANTVKSNYHPVFPLATMIVNLTGAFLLGLLIGLGLNGNVYAFTAIGFLGAFTTFSTFKVETLKLFKTGKKIKALQYLAGSYAGGLIAAYCGLIIGY